MSGDDSDPDGRISRRRFTRMMGIGGLGLAIGPSLISRFVEARSGRSSDEEFPASPEHTDRNLLAAADALVPSLDEDDPGARDVPVTEGVELPAVGEVTVASANGVLQIFKSLLALEQEYVRSQDGETQAWDPVSVSRRISDVLDEAAQSRGADAYHHLPRADREAILEELYAAPTGSQPRLAFRVLYNYMLMGFYTGYPGVVVPDQPRPGWDAVGYEGHFAPPFGAGEGERDPEIELIERRKAQLAARGVDTTDLVELERLVDQDWDHFEAVEGGWRV